MGEFESVLRAQVADARRELVAARETRDFDGIKSFGLRLRYLLDIAEEHRVELLEAGAPEMTPGSPTEDGV